MIKNMFNSNVYQEIKTQLLLFTILLHLFVFDCIWHSSIAAVSNLCRLLRCGNGLHLTSQCNRFDFDERIHGQTGCLDAGTGWIVGRECWNRMAPNETHLNAQCTHSVRLGVTFFVRIIDSTKIVHILYENRRFHHFFQIRTGRNQHILQIMQSKFGLSTHTTINQFARSFVQTKAPRHINGAIGDHSLTERNILGVGTK